ncbi:MAG: Crp/Fnr family transcriptional regulator [Eggerthellaceae bacterium]|nr:Crp/Fnr family transcriptional regulator [Eggerthellaceae bacterium]
MAEVEGYLKQFFPFWETLTKQQQNALIAGTRPAQFSAGDHVHSGENDCIGVLLVLEGELRAYMLSASGRECTLFRVYENETCVLAATCILKMITFDLFMDAEKDTVLLVIDPDVYARILEENVSMEAYTYKQSADRFSDVMWVMQQQLFMGLDGRLAVFLLDEVARQKGDKLKLTHDEIARHIGSAREAVSRMLKTFADKGIVTLSRGYIEVADKSKLHGLINE